MRLAQLPFATGLHRLARSTREPLNTLAQRAEPATSCSSMRNEPDRQTTRDPEPTPTAPPFFSRRRQETRSLALPFHNFLRANAGRDRAKDSVAIFVPRGSLLCRLVSRVTTSSLLPYVLFPATGAD